MRAECARLALLICLALPGAARSDPSDLCLQAARQAASESGVPYPVLLAISQTETGRRQGGETRPWPWTVNMEGAGHWFDSRAAALSFVDRHHADGARSYDLGCFQINYRWHGQAFPNRAAMIDPVQNARYAARFLSDLYAETGDWSRAAGHYHSRTKVHADRYRTRFDRFHAAARSAPAPAPVTPTPATPPTEPGPAPNSFPLLQARGGGRAPGSLVPLGDG